MKKLSLILVLRKKNRKAKQSRRALRMLFKIAKKTEELENQTSQKLSKMVKRQEQVQKPFYYYRKQESFYQGLFWICIALLIVLWS